MKKTIALIISVILVVAIFASCTPEDIEDVATIDEETETDAIDSEATKDINLDDKDNKLVIMGFYLKGNPNRRLIKGSEVPKNSQLAFLNWEGAVYKYGFWVNDGRRLMHCYDWYGSGNTAYTVEEIDRFFDGDNLIRLTPKS